MITEIASPKHLWREMRRELFLMLLVSCLAYYFHHHVYTFELDIPEGALGIFGLAITFFVIFRSNKVYERWWEARIIWGQVVNDSRTWAMKVMALINIDTARDGLTTQQIQKTQHELIYRHLAFINALRMHLRHQQDWDELAEYIEPDELKELLYKANKPTHLIHKQAQCLEEFFGKGVEQGRYKVEMLNILRSMYDDQGKCERIKNTPFPKHYTFLTDVTVWCYAAMICVYFVSQFRIVLKADMDILTIPMATAVGAIIVGLERLAKFHEDPFDMEIHTTPMSALCRSIEIDLREQLGETVKIGPLVPDHGVLR